MPLELTVPSLASLPKYLLAGGVSPQSPLAAKELLLSSQGSTKIEGVFKLRFRNSNHSLQLGWHNMPQDSRLFLTEIYLLDEGGEVLKANFTAKESARILANKSGYLGLEAEFSVAFVNQVWTKGGSIKLVLEDATSVGGRVDTRVLESFLAGENQGAAALLEELSDDEPEGQDAPKAPTPALRRAPVPEAKPIGKGKASARPTSVQAAPVAGPSAPQIAIPAAAVVDIPQVDFYVGLEKFSKLLEKIMAEPDGAARIVRRPLSQSWLCIFTPY